MRREILVPYLRTLYEYELAHNLLVREINKEKANVDAISKEKNERLNKVNRMIARYNSLIQAEERPTINIAEAEQQAYQNVMTRANQEFGANAPFTIMRNLAGNTPRIEKTYDGLVGAISFGFMNNQRKKYPWDQVSNVRDVNEAQYYNNMWKQMRDEYIEREKSRIYQMFHSSDERMRRERDAYLNSLADKKQSQNKSSISHTKYEIDQLKADYQAYCDSANEKLERYNYMHDLLNKVVKYKEMLYQANIIPTMYRRADYVAYIYAYISTSQEDNITNVISIINQREILNEIQRIGSRVGQIVENQRYVMNEIHQLRANVNAIQNTNVEIQKQIASMEGIGQTQNMYLDMIYRYSQANYYCNVSMELSMLEDKWR